MKKNKNNAIIFFDGFCNLCNRSVRMVLKFEKQPYFLFSPITSDFTKTFFKENYNEKIVLNSIILFENDTFYYKSDAVLKITEHFKTPFNLFKYIRYIPKPLRDFIYDIIATYRFSIFGKRDSCSIPSISLTNRFL